MSACQAWPRVSGANDMLRSLSDDIAVSSLKLARAADYSVELQHSGPARLPAIYHNLHLVGVVLSGEPLVIRRLAGSETRTRYRAGISYIRPSGPGAGIIWPDGFHALYVHLHPRLIRRVAQRMTGTEEWTLGFRSRLDDDVIRSTGLELHRLHETGALTGPAVHDQVLRLAEHLVMSYGAPAPPRQRIGRLYLEQVLDALREESADWGSVEALARQAGLSRAYFTRRIRQLTSLSPYLMVAASRIESAKYWLAQPGMSLAEVAHRSGFADQSHLTRLFRAATGLTPARYRAEAHKPSRRRVRPTPR